MEGFDLGTAKPIAAREDEGQVVHVQDATGEPLYFGKDKTPVTITVAGTYSSTYRRAEEARSNRRLKRRSASITAETVERERLAVVSACVLGWEGFFDNGKPMTCTVENVQTVLRIAPWILLQVEGAMEDHVGFSSNSSES